MYIKVQNRFDLVRDKDSAAVLNIDNTGLAAYKARRDKERRIDEMETAIKDIKSDLYEIKQLFHKFLESK